MRIYRGSKYYIDSSRVKNLLFKRNRKEFVSYIALQKSKQKKIENWYATSIASHSNLQTDFYDNLIGLLTAEYYVKHGICDVVIVDDYRLYKLLNDNFDFKISVSSYFNFLFTRFKDFIKNICILFLSRGRFFFRIVASQILMNPEMKDVKDSVFLYTWLEERCFSKGNFQEQYLTGLEGIKFSKGTTVFLSYYANYSLVKYFDLIQLSITGLQNYFSIFKFIKLFFKFPSFEKINPIYKNLNIDYLWKFEKIKELTKSNFIMNLLEYEAWIDFFEDANGILVYPFENQPWEKLMLLARRKVKNADFKLYGYQHGAIGLNFLSYMSSELEMKSLDLPDAIIANSDDNKNYLKKHFKGFCNIFDGGSLRYKENIRHSKAIDLENIVIGVFLPIARNQALDLLFHIIDESEKTYFKFLIKSHPNTNISHIKLNSNSFHYKDTAKNLYDISDGIVYCSSSSGSEAYSMGIPIFRYQGYHIDYLMGENSFQPKVIHSILDIKVEDLKKTGYSGKNNLYSKVDWKFWQNLLNQ